MNSRYEFTLKEGPKVKMEKILGTESWRKNLEGLKWKVDVFMGTKIIFNPYIFEVQVACLDWLIFKFIKKVEANKKQGQKMVT